MEASTVSQSRLIGALLVEKNLITSEQLDQALLLQVESGERIGEIMVSEFGVSRLEIAGVLAEQWADTEMAESKAALKLVEPLTPAEVRLRRPIGQILVEQGLIRKDQLDAALAAQSRSGARIGEILVEQGALGRQELESALRDQWSSPVTGSSAPVAVDGQPGWNGSPVSAAPAQGWSADDHAVVADLEERLRIVEWAAGGTPWQEDLRLVTFDLRAALNAVEERLTASLTGSASTQLTAALEAVGSRIDALENAPVLGEFDALRQELDELRARPVAVEGIDEIRAAVERLEGRPDRAAEISNLASEVGVLATRLDELAAVGDLKDMIETVAGQAEVAQTGFTELARRVDELAGLESRLEEVAAHVPDADVVEKLREALAELDTPAETGALVEQGGEIASLAARLDLLAARVDDVAAAPVPDLAPRIDDLSARVDEVVAAIPPVETDGLAARIASLEEDGRAGSGVLDRLATEFGELGARTQERLDDLASREPDPAPVDELRARLEDLAGRVREPDPRPLHELRARVEELAVAVEGAPDASLVAGVGSRLEELAAAVERISDPAPVDELRARLDDLAGRVREPDPRPLHELRARVEELAAQVARDESVGVLESRVGELEDRLAAATPPAQLREEFQRTSESTVVERESLMQALSARIEEIGATVPHDDELRELRSRLAELEDRPTGDHALQARVAGLSARLEGLGTAEAAIAGLRESLTSLDTLRASDTVATGARLEELQAAIDSLAELETRVRKGVDRALADRTEALATRLEGAESRLDDVAALDESVAALAAELESRPDGDSLAGVAAELRAELAVLADRLTVVDPTERLLGLSQRIDRSTHAANGRVDGLDEELSLRISGLAEELGRRLDDVDRRADGLVRRDEAAASAAEQAASVQKELAMLRHWADTRAAAVDHTLAAADDARTQGQQELGNRVDEAVGAIRSDLEAQGAALGGELEAGASETAALRARVDTLVEAAAGRAAWEASLTSMFEQRLEGLAALFAEEVAGARADAEQAVGAVRRETGSLGARVDELQSQRDADVQAAGSKSERLEERAEALAGLRADDAKAARVAAADLSARLERLAESVRVEAAGGRTAIKNAAGRIDGLHGLWVDDLAAAERAGAELAARLDDQATQASAAVSEVEQVLRTEFGEVAARLEERDARGTEAREELRGEFERIASSVGWRLERIEESLASDQRWNQLEEMVTGLGRRLEEQAAIDHEQVRATEHALRHGLASLGERLTGTESAYVDASNALQRSIECLGAEVVETDARIADQVPVSEAEGYVAFAPTAAGYRLVELPGRQPEVGSTVEVDGAEGPLVVTRYGRSPLPLDGRPCAYLDRA